MKSKPLAIRRKKMGCDYYTWIETIIVYKDLSGTVCRFVERGPTQRRYEDVGEIDTDFKLPPTTGQILADEIRTYSQKKMFMDNYWLCHYNGKMRIRELCTANEIPFDSLIEVYKQLGGRVA
jgi:hypothetical protein